MANEIGAADRGPKGSGEMRKFAAALFAGLVLVGAVAPAADAGPGGGGKSKPCICLPGPSVM